MLAMRGHHKAALRQRPLALAGGVMLAVALVGVPGHFNPEVCNKRDAR